MKGIFDAELVRSSIMMHSFSTLPSAPCTSLVFGRPMISGGKSSSQSSTRYVVSGRTIYVRVEPTSWTDVSSFILISASEVVDGREIFDRLVDLHNALSDWTHDKFWSINKGELSGIETSFSSREMEATYCLVDGENWIPCGRFPLV
jgi:hypothetical protein